MAAFARSSFKTQLPKGRLSQVRSVLFLMIAFVVYFSMARPAVASSALVQNTKSVTHSVSHSVSHGPSVQESVPFEEGVPLSCDDCDFDDSESDSHFELDEFLATPSFYKSFDRKLVYQTEDMHLSLPAFSRGLEYPPDALI